MIVGRGVVVEFSFFIYDRFLDYLVYKVCRMGGGDRVFLSLRIMLFLICRNGKKMGFFFCKWVFKYFFINS